MTIFTIIYTVLLPIFMILIGWVWRKNGPKDINNFYGYRTKLSMENQEQWDYAHKECGKVWSLFGSIGLVASLPFVVKYFTWTNEEMSNMSMIPILIQLVLVVGSIIPVEIKLRKKFRNNKVN